MSLHHNFQQNILQIYSRFFICIILLYNRASPQNCFAVEIRFENRVKNDCQQKEKFIVSWLQSFTVHSKLFYIVRYVRNFLSLFKQ